MAVLVPGREGKQRKKVYPAFSFVKPASLAALCSPSCFHESHPTSPCILGSWPNGLKITAKDQQELFCPSQPPTLHSALRQQKEVNNLNNTDSFQVSLVKTLNTLL